MTKPDLHAHEMPEDGVPHVSLKEYLTGFFLSVFLTVVPFALVMGDFGLSSRAVIAVLVIFAALQVVVHMVFFLHMNPRSEDGWNLLALVFTAVLVVIVLAGSLWVMHNMTTNMMPRHDMEQMQATPRNTP